MIAVDGPSGSGKSTAARRTAAVLGLRYLDTGAMYRAVALMALRLGREPGEVAGAARIEVGERVLLEGEDVTEAIRAPEVSEAASRAAADPAVREAMVAEQRRLMYSSPPTHWVAEGRDIGTVVAPGAEVKVFLTASPEERAARRAAQIGADVQIVLAEQRIRDERDSRREYSPLAPAPGAVQLDTTGLTLDEVVERIVALTPSR